MYYNKDIKKEVLSGAVLPSLPYEQIEEKSPNESIHRTVKSHRGLAGSDPAIAQRPLLNVMKV
jgi:hypothetical protein